MTAIVNQNSPNIWETHLPTNTEVHVRSSNTAGGGESLGKLLSAGLAPTGRTVLRTTVSTGTYMVVITMTGNQACIIRIPQSCTLQKLSLLHTEHAEKYFLKFNWLLSKIN